jgi:hypothetical protein
MGGACSTHGRYEKCIHYMLVRETQGSMPLGKTRSKCENNIRMDVMEIGWEGVDSIHLAQDRDR